MAGRWLVQGRIVLQDGCSWLRNCIAIQFIVLQEEADLAGIVLQNLYCRRLGYREFVSQYKNCIVRCSGKRRGCLCRKTGSCVATRRWAGALGARLGARGAQAGTGGALGRAGGRGAGGANGRPGRARGRGRRAGRRAGARQACGRNRGHSRHAAGARGGARPRRWAHWMGARAGYRLCTRCTRSVFDPVRLGIVPESIFGHYS